MSSGELEAAAAEAPLEAAAEAEAEAEVAKFEAAAVKFAHRFERFGHVNAPAQRSYSDFFTEGRRMLQTPPSLPLPFMDQQSLAAVATKSGLLFGGSVPRDARELLSTAYDSFAMAADLAEKIQRHRANDASGEFLDLGLDFDLDGKEQRGGGKTNGGGRGGARGGGVAAVTRSVLARGGGGDWLSPADVSSLKAVAQANADAVRQFITGRFFDMKDMAEPLSEADLHFDYSKSAVYPILSVPDPSTKASSV